MATGLVTGDDGLARCGWGASTPEYSAYHDDEWGRPVVDDQRLFEKICLEGFQAGLSWLTILRKRDHFRQVFDGFDIARIARYRAPRVERLLRDPGIIRHRGKIESTINNAGRALAIQREFGSLARYFWQFEPDPASRPKRLTFPVLKAMSTTPESITLSKDLKRRGWTFVGPTTIYAFMQAMGLVNDHVEGCHCRETVARLRGRFRSPAGGRGGSM